MNSRSDTMDQPAPATAPEFAVTRVNRLAEELAFAMDDWMDDISHPDYPRAIWEAHVWPESTGRGIYFQNYSIEARETARERMDRLGREFVYVAKQVEPDATEWTLRKEASA